MDHRGRDRHSIVSKLRKHWEQARHALHEFPPQWGSLVGKCLRKGRPEGRPTLSLAAMVLHAQRQTQQASAINTIEGANGLLLLHEDQAAHPL